MSWKFYNHSDIEKIVNNHGSQSTSLTKRISEWYYSPKSFENDGKIYEYLGIKPFKRLLMKTVGKSRKIEDGDELSNYFIGKDKSVDKLKLFEKETRYNETLHAGPAIAEIAASTFFTCLYFSEKVNDTLPFIYGMAILSGIAGVIEGYCAMLQRYNRARIQPIIDYKCKKALDKIN